MGILVNLVLAIIHAIAVAVDILLFFMIIRLLCYKWKHPLILSISGAGSKLIEQFISLVQAQLKHLTNKSYSNHVVLLTSTSLLLVARLLIVAFFGA